MPAKRIIWTERNGVIIEHSGKLSEKPKSFEFKHAKTGFVAEFETDTEKVQLKKEEGKQTEEKRKAKEVRVSA